MSLAQIILNKMDFDINLFLNFIPIISITTITLVTCTTAFYKIRNRWPVKVNCWFCNCNAKVQRQSLDWWFCPHCEQYNGFSEDGDYNYEIPEQHRVKRRSRIIDKSYCQRKACQPSQNSLCEKCNTKEELKLYKLRELEDSIDEFNDKKLSRFELKFEQKFPLCLKCQSLVQNVLHQQRAWMTQYKMLLFKQKPIKRMIENREWIEKIVRMLLSILASVAIYFTEAWYLPLCGILFQLVACIASPVGNRKSDIFPILGWTCLILIRAFSTTAILKMFEIYYNNDWVPEQDSTYQYFIITLSTVVGLSNLKFKSSKTLFNGSLAFKKLESPAWKNTASRSSSPETLFDEEPIIEQDKPRNFHSPVNITDALMTPAAVETPIPLRPASFSQWSNADKKMSSSISSTSRAFIFAPEPDNQLVKMVKSQSYSLNDSLSSLNSLSLGSQSKISASHSPKVFETRVYSTTSPDIFNRQHRHSQKRSILAPPKLHSVTQSSWVAGGYWQSGIDMPTLSRSSSQSSGFGSAGSNYGHSREPSIHESDQCSVASERCCNFTRPESPLPTHNANAARIRSNTCSTSCSQISDCTARSSPCNALNNTKCTGHANVVTSPMFSILLCGSLVLNIVVLCTILLRW